MKDFHCHLLPGLDDGAHSISDTEKMLQSAGAAGIDAIAATSHYSPACDNDYDKAWETVQPLAARYGVQLLKGMEYDLAYLADVPKASLRALGDSPYLLVDMNANFIMPGMENLFFELKVAGFQIIFAHPERMLSAGELQKLLKILEDNAIFIQVDTGSLTGRYGKLAQCNARTVLDRGGCHFLWNDAHKPEHFPVAECRRIVEKRYGVEAWKLLTEINPAALLAGDEIQPMPPRPVFWARCFAALSGHAENDR